MDLDFNNLLNNVTEFIKSEAKTETVVGNQFQLGEFSCVPIIKVSFGFGTGGGEGSDPKHGKGEGAGAGAGVNIEPIGFLVSKGEEISFLGTKNSKGISALFEKVPDILEKFIQNKATETA